MCKQCEIKPVYEFTNQRKLCAMCFVRYFQKKVLYTIRKFEMVKSGDVIGYFGGTTQWCTLRAHKNLQAGTPKNLFTKGMDFKDVVLEDVLKMFAEKGHVEVVKLPSRKKITKIAYTDTTDSVADEIVHEVVEKGVSAHPPVSLVKSKCPPNSRPRSTGAIGGFAKSLAHPESAKLIIRPLYLFLDKEVLLYAKLRKLHLRVYTKEVRVPLRGPPLRRIKT